MTFSPHPIQSAFDPSNVDIEALLKKLNLANARRHWRSLIDQAEREDWSCRDFLALLVSEEIAHREQTRLQRAVRKAHFPFLKTIDEYDFSLRPKVRRALIDSYLSPEFVSEGRNLILIGRTGRGKTHLAVAIAYRAIQNGFNALFTTAAALIGDLSLSMREANFREGLKVYTSPHVLIIDEIGYLTYGPDAANVLFHVVNDRHLNGRPTVFTTNKSPFSEWGRVLHDPDLADAIVDRVLERGRLIVLDGPSARTRHIDRLSLEGKVKEAATISGIRPPYFPEPTKQKSNGREVILSKLFPSAMLTMTVTTGS